MRFKRGREVMDSSLECNLCHEILYPHGSIHYKLVVDHMKLKHPDKYNPDKNMYPYFSKENKK